MVVLIKDIIPQLLEEKVDWHRALLQNWQSIVGTLKTRIRIEKIYDNTLIIGVYESHWMQELYLLSSVLIDSVNTFLGEPRIAHLRFKLVEEKKRTPFLKKSVKTRKQTALRLSVAQEKALASLKDEQLKKALRDFWGRCQESLV